MSSPLESLKKNKKVPLNGAERLGRAPYKKNLLNTTHHVDALSSTSDRGIDGRAHSQAPTNMELLSSMAGRLTQTEQQLRYSTKELIDKDKKIQILEEKVQLLEKARGYSSETVQDLERRCKSLQQQVHEMEEFLADYGMIWVGGDDITSSGNDVEQGNFHRSDVKQDIGSTTDLWTPGSSVVSKSFEMDFNLVVKNIEQLNMLSGSNNTVVSHTKAGATFKARDLVPLTLYANGISMFSGPFRPYTEETTQRCMQDIMDGYFPSELETRYPDGVPFKVIDKREVVFKDRRTEILFPGSGQPLDSNTREPSNNRGDGARVHSLNEINENKEYKMPVDKFLNNLPPSLIKNGKIIDIRAGIADTLKGSSLTSGENTVTVIDTPVIKEIKSRAKSGIERPLSGHQVTTLRIKSENGDQTYILKLNFTDTIGDVRQYINKMRPELCDNYSIKTSFPNKVHNNHHITLDEAGLTPNATLHILLRK